MEHRGALASTKWNKNRPVLDCLRRYDPVFYPFLNTSHKIHPRKNFAVSQQHLIYDVLPSRFVSAESSHSIHVEAIVPTRNVLFQVE